MRYIDTLRHVRVGSLAGYPLYHPLERVRGGNKRGHPEFACDPTTIVMGGGSGEHPGLVVHRFDQLVRLYLLHAMDLRALLAEPANPDLEALEDYLVGGLKLDFDDFFEFCGWGVEETAQLLTRATCQTMSSPYSRAEYVSVEHWLAYSLGEYCFMNQPELMGESFTSGLANHASACLELKSYWMSNVQYES